MKIAIYTLGCKVNQFETQALERELTGRGHTLTDFDQPADAYIINTCTVTAVSDKKSRQAIHQAKSRNPNAVVAVCGCYAQTAPEQVAQQGVDLISGTNDHVGLLCRLEELAGQKQGAPLVRVDNVMTRRVFEYLPAGGLEGRTRAMLKVEDGCVHFCSYCIIPYARGPVRSLPLEAAEQEAGRLAGEGYREIVLTGIEISSYGADFRDGTALIDLVERVCAAAPNLRVRLGSLEPRTVTPEFCRRLAELPNLCPHFHLSLQSGCDATLQRMNRKYDSSRFLEAVDLLRRHFDRPGITGDLIVGFPGETEEEFTRSLAFVEQVGFSALHVFPYSRRAGTPAARMEGQIPRKVKQDRARQAGELARRLEQDYLTSFEGETLSVLLEDQQDGLWRGHAPNYVQVRLPSEEFLHNQIRNVAITEAGQGYLLGRDMGGEN